MHLYPVPHWYCRIVVNLDGREQQREAIRVAAPTEPTLEEGSGGRRVKQELSTAVRIWVSRAYCLDHSTLLEPTVLAALFHLYQ
jgi:hypothetical protein